MDKPLKRSTTIFLALAVGVPILLKVLMDSVGIAFVDGGVFPIFCLINLAVFGAFAYRSHTAGQPRPAEVAQAGAATTSRTSGGTPSLAMAILAGGTIGFLIGCLTRPVFPITGEKLPLYLLLEPAGPMFAGLKADFMTHMIVTTLIGVIAGVVLMRVVASLKRA